MFVDFFRAPGLPLCLSAFVCAALHHPVEAQDANAADLAQQLSNPVADLISVPLQLNFDDDIGPDDSGSRWVLNIQPVVPISLSDDWNLISRTILPVVSTDDIPAGSGSETGLGDTVQSLFFSPKLPSSAGWIWGAGPVFVLPTSSEDTLGAGSGAPDSQASPFDSKGLGPMEG